MTIDILEYNRILEDMILGLEAIKNWKKQEVLNVLRPMFRALHVAKFK